MTESLLDVALKEAQTEAATISEVRELVSTKLGRHVSGGEIHAATIRLLDAEGGVWA